MRHILTAILATSLITAAITATDSIAQKSATPPTTTTNSSRKFRLRLTLSNPQDLKIKEGDRIKEGEIISDRSEDRARLEAQKRQLEIQLEQMNRAILKPIAPKSIPVLKNLPDPLYLPQWTEIDRQRLEVSRAEEEKISQIKKLEALKALKVSDVILEHEKQKIKDTESDYAAKIADLEKAKASLEKAKRDQAYSEYSFKLEESKREIAVNHQDLEYQNQLQRQQSEEREKAYKITLIKQQIINIENQIALLSSVRSPYNAKVQRVKFVEQNNRDLVVDVVLSIDRGDRPASTSPQTSGDQIKKSSTSSTTQRSDDGDE